MSDKPNHPAESTKPVDVPKPPPPKPDPALVTYMERSPKNDRKPE
jgi:hypothetical protein